MRGFVVGIETGAALLVALALSGVASAQAAGAAGSTPSSIFTCTDSRGRTLTSDRPIPDCADREQRELGPDGSTRRRIEPTYTAKEMIEREERQRQASIAAQRQTEERRRERALLMRFPNATVHDRERADAIAQIEVVISAAKKRVAELSDERRKVDDELEFYKKDLSKAPPSIRRQLDDNAQSAAVQNRFIGEQEEEKRRLNARFDEERTRLKPLWGPSAAR